MPRRKTTSPDVCWIVVRMLALKDNLSAISISTGVPERTIRDIRHRFLTTGDPTVPKSDPRLRGRKRMLSMDDLNFLQASIQKRPDAYLSELARDLREICGISTSESNIWHALHRSGFSRKQIMKLAIERNEEKRDEYLVTIGQYSPEQLVFVDESAVDRRTPGRRYGWARLGKRAKMHGHFVRGARYSLLPALSLDGIIYSQIREGSFTGELFFDFVSSLLDHMQPFPNPNSVLVMDNCAIHKVAGIRQLVEEKGVRLVYLPPYSPDFNPIELAFSSIKSHLREKSTEVQLVLTGKRNDAVPALLLLHEAVYTVTSEKAYSWFKHCGYVY